MPLGTVRERKWEQVIYIDVDGSREDWGRGNQATSPLRFELSFTFSRVEEAEYFPDEKGYGTRYIMRRPFLSERGLTNQEEDSVAKHMAEHDAVDERYIKTCSEWNQRRRQEGSDCVQEYRPTDGVRLLYNDATWQTLLALRSRLQQAREQLMQLADQKKAERLLALGDTMKLLEAAKP